MGARWSSSARHDQERSTAADYADYWSPTICFLSQPRQFQHWRCDPHTRTPLFTNHKCVGRVQHRGAHEAPARTTIKLEYRKLSDEVVLEWTHPSNAHLENPAEFTIVLSCCVCCGPAKVGDVQAQDLTPKGLPALLSRVQHEHGFWVHCPMRQRTFYFYGKNSEEQKEWVLLIRHNLEALRARPNADAFVMLKCKQTLGQHGYSKDEQGRRLNKVKQALRDRRFRQIDQKSDHLEDRIGKAIYQGRAGKLAALMGHQPSSRGAIQYIQENGWPVDKTFSEDLGGNSLLIEAVKRDAMGVLLLLLERKAEVNTRNVDGDTALILASRLGRQSAVVQLLLSGANLDATNRFGETARTEATPDVAALLKQHKSTNLSVWSLNTVDMSTRSTLTQDCLEISSAGLEISPFSASVGPEYDDGA